MQITSLDADDYKGRYVIGRIKRGKVSQGQSLSVVAADGSAQRGKVDYLFTHKGLNRLEVNEAAAGDIIALTGFDDVHIGDTLTEVGHEDALPPLDISEPTVQMQFLVSTSPFVGKDGQFNTSRQLKERLAKELERNVGLRVGPGPSGESFIVSGRGELHLSILIETMRREGYEFSVARPEVIFKTTDQGVEEPWEQITLEVPEEYVGVVTTEMGQRKANFKGMRQLKSSTRMEYEIATRHLIGFRSEFQTKTSGMGVVHSLPIGYQPKGDDLPWNRNGVIIAAETGVALSYGLQKAQERGSTFVEPSTEVYAGMIVGQNTKKEDLVMAVTKGKKLTNMRASSADQFIKMTPPVVMSLEQCLTFLGPDELLEVTPLNLRLRKRDLKAAANR